jgi:Predicted metal-dependent enzyme
MMKKTMIGGQALLEGLLMMGPSNIAIAVRKPDGEIVLDKKPLPAKSVISKIPLVRGAFLLFRQMVIGVKALMYSAEFVELEEGEEEKPSKVDAFIERLFGNKMKDAVIYFSVILSLAFSIGLFILLPNIIVGLLNLGNDRGSNVILKNLVEGVIRIILFFGYIYFASMLKDIKRVWQYHGAEHKTIHCYEHGEKLTVQNIRKHSTKHPRCGTSFMFLVMIISIIVFSFLGWHGPVMNVLLRLIFIPVVAGVSYEILKFAGRHTDWLVMKIINAPGMLFQLFTTKEPDDEQIEVAIVAFNNVLVEDKDADNW